VIFVSKFPALVSVRFPLVSLLYEGKRLLRFLFVSSPFPCRSLRFQFPAYIRATGNEAVLPTKKRRHSQHMSGKYDPPNKAALLAQFRRTPSTVELAVAAAEAQFPQNVKADDEASRARLSEDASSRPRKRGRKPVVTPERVEIICELLAHGESEKSACIRTGIGLTAWNTAKRSNPSLGERIAAARDEWARLRHARHAAALYESQSMRLANRKALKPQPTHQAKLVAWHLTYRVPLNFAAIPEAEIAQACERFNLTLETWARQERAFGLLRKIYAKRAKIRGEQPLQATANIIPWL
jgi:hypothetical protein